VSHTRVPTESRPGHVALIGMSVNIYIHFDNILIQTHNCDPAGMYEDVSAVTKVGNIYHLCCSDLFTMTLYLGMERKSGILGQRLIHWLD
jgi:hypothetical protein